MSWYRWDGEDLELRVRVQPRAPKDAFVEPDPSGDYYRVRLKAPPVEGKANAHLMAFLGKAFGVAKSLVTLESGELNRQKRVRIRAPQKLPAELASELQAGR